MKLFFIAVGCVIGWFADDAFRWVRGVFLHRHLKQAEGGEKMNIKGYRTRQEPEIKVYVHAAGENREAAERVMQELRDLLRKENRRRRHRGEALVGYSVCLL